MSSTDSFERAFEGLKQSQEAGRTAHAYLIVGSPRGNAAALAEAFIQLLFCTGAKKPCGECEACRSIRERTHPDVLWIKPESKSRRIPIEMIREELNPRIAQTSYAGGWKVGVLVHADRLTTEAANAFLKTLEEPPGRSLLLLLTDSVQSLLPTIVSRCQRIMLSESGDDSPWRERVLEILRETRGADPLQAAAAAGRLKAILDEARKAIEAEETERVPDDEPEEVTEARIASRVAEVRSAILCSMLLWQRDLLLTVAGAGSGVLHFPEDEQSLQRQAAGLSVGAALRRVQSVETMVRRLDRHLPDEAVFEAGFGGRA